MHWIAPSEKDTDNAALEKRLWDAADQFRANSGLKSQEYSAPVLGLIFLRFAAQRAKLESPSPLGGERAGVRGDSSHPRPSDGRGAGGEGAPRVSRRGSRVDEPAAYHAEARFDYLLNRPEAENIGAKVNAAMRDVAKCEVRVANVEVQSVRQSKFVIRHSPIPASLDYDAFGRIYERAEYRIAKCEFRSEASSTVETRQSKFV